MADWRLINGVWTDVDFASEGDTRLIGGTWVTSTAAAAGEAGTERTVLTPDGDVVTFNIADQTVLLPNGSVLNADITTSTAAQSIAVSLITENETLFSPAAPSAAQSIAVSLITENETLFSPTVVPGAVSAAPGLITENETLFAVTVTPGAVSASPGLITENETLFSPTALAGVQSVAVNLITENESLFSPSITTGATSIVVGLITENETLFSPTAAPSISIAAALITENETLFSPSVSVGSVSIAPGLITENETLFAATAVGTALGGTFNAAGYFPTGQSDVVITLYDPETGLAVSTDDNACGEIGATGLYIWDAANLTTPVTGYQEYIWSMTDGATTQGGVLRMFDSTDSDRLMEIWQRLGLDSANPLTNKSDGGIEVDTIDIQATESGSDIIQTRQ